MAKAFTTALFLLILSACSTTRQALPLLRDDNLTYVDKASAITLKLPRVKGWTAGIPAKEELARNIVYGAVHIGKILNLVLSVEALNSELEDYFILIRRANSFNTRSGYDLMELDTFTLNGQKSMRFIYKADVITVDSELLYEDTLAEDSLADTLAAEDSTDTLSPYIYTPYIYTNIFMRHEEFNYWLEISTLEEGYERRRPFIEDVIKGLRVME